MSDKLQWIGRNLSLGGLLRHAGTGVGKAGKYGAKAAGAAAALVVRNPSRKREIADSYASAGDNFDDSMAAFSAKAGHSLNYGVQQFSKGTGKVCGSAARAVGMSEPNVEFAEKLGTVAGAVGIGLVVGGGIAEVAIAAGAIAGTSGAAATSSGLAALGGSSMAVSGGGVIAGTAVVDGIVSAAAVSGAATMADDEEAIRMELQRKREAELLEEYMQTVNRWKEAYLREAEYFRKADCFRQEEDPEQKDMGRDEYLRQEEYLRQADYLRQEKHLRQSEYVRQEDYAKQEDALRQADYLAQDEYLGQSNASAKARKPKRRYSSLVMTRIHTGRKTRRHELLRQCGG
jgi:hypothetical protein